jgi:hypothetical protein
MHPRQSGRDLVPVRQNIKNTSRTTAIKSSCADKTVCSRFMELPHPPTHISPRTLEPNSRHPGRRGVRSRSQAFARLATSRVVMPVGRTGANSRARSPIFAMQKVVGSSPITPPHTGEEEPAAVPGPSCVFGLVSGLVRSAPPRDRPQLCSCSSPGRGCREHGAFLPAVAPTRCRSRLSRSSDCRAPATRSSP